MDIDNTKIFKVICYSKTRYIAVIMSIMLTVLPISFFLLKYGIVGQALIVCYIIIISFAPLTSVYKLTSAETLQIELHYNILELKWLKSYWRGRIKNSLKINLDEVKSYQYESSYNFSTFKLRLKTNKKIVFHRWIMDSDDDFDKFMTQFKQMVKYYNSRKSTTEPIIREKSIMENRIFLISVGTILVILLLSGILSIFLVSKINVKGLILFLGLLAPLTWVLMKVVNSLKEGINDGNEI